MGTRALRKQQTHMKVILMPSYVVIDKFFKLIHVTDEEKISINNL
jgi:hypothetical protein